MFRPILALAAVVFSLVVVRAQPVAPTPEQLASLRAAATPPRAALGTPLTVNTSSREEVRQFYRAVYSASEGIPLNWTGSHATGNAGDISTLFREAVILRINFFRALVGVPATVTLNTTFSGKAQQAALMMSANNALDHHPPTSWTFYTAAGAEAAASSNIAIGYAGVNVVTGYMSDGGANNAAVGHRRWFIYPQTREMGVGHVSGTDSLPPGNAVWVMDGQFGTMRPATRTTAVPYPPAGYVPYQLVWPRWSFSYPDADFTNATVAMTRNGQSVATSVQFRADGAGEPALVWVYDGHDPNEDTEHARPTADTTYTVNVNNVVIAGAAQNFTYDVTVFDPDVAGSDFVATTVSGSATPPVGASTSYSVAKPSFASSFDWRTLQLADFTKIYGAETGLDGVSATTTAGYSVVQNGVVGSGSSAFHLAHPAYESQVLTLPETFYVSSSSAAVSFLSRLGWATTVQVARVQVSTDTGASWTDIYTQAGADNSGETTFQSRSASLAAFAGKTVRIRFAYTVGNSAFPQTEDGVGWYVDNIALSGAQSATASTSTNVASGTTFAFTPSAAGVIGLQARGVLFGAYPLEWGPVALVNATASTAPTFSAQPSSQTTTAGGSVTLSATTSTNATYAWQVNGAAIAGASNSSLTLSNVQPASTGLYTVVATNGGASTTSAAAIVGLSTSAKIVGTSQEVGSDILHPNKNVFDQILLSETSISFRADSDRNQITRMSYVDLSDDIVQIEFAGPGTVSVVLTSASGPAIPVNYNQDNVTYMKGHAGIVVTGATKDTHLSVFSVGRGNAVNQTLFKDNVDYDGFADIGFIAIQSADGQFGGLRTANASYVGTAGFTGVYAPGVQFTGPVFVGDINASVDATPVLVIGSALGNTWITGGDLQQTNGRAVQVAGLTRLEFKDGTTSHYSTAAPNPAEYLLAQTNQARLEQDGVDVTAQIVVNP